MPNNPWKIADNESFLTSSDGTATVRYEQLSEWRMNAPLGGECYIDVKLNVNDVKSYKVSDMAGYPAVWKNDGKSFAIPLWIIVKNEDEEQSQTVFQRLGVVDVEKLTLTTYQRKFEVLNIESFVSSTVTAIDSPIYLPKNIEFDIEKEAVESVVELRFV